MMWLRLSKGFFEVAQLQAVNHSKAPAVHILLTIVGERVRDLSQLRRRLAFPEQLEPE